MSFERRLLTAAVIAWFAVAIISILTGPPMGHDESAFGIIARGGGQTWLYRSSGAIWIAKIGVALGGSDAAMRTASVVLGCGVVLAAWLLGRLVYDARVGAWSATIIAGAHPMVLRSAELLGDLPATACMVAGLAVLASELGRDTGPRWRLVWVAPLFAGAFYCRYGSAPVIVLAAALAVIAWPRAIVRRPLPLIATAAVFALLLAPHAIQSLRATGSLLGILEYSSKMPRRAYVGEGLVTYFTSDPFYFYGALIAPVAVAGLAGWLLPPRRRATLFLGAVAIGQIVAIGLQSHAQPRYIFVATTVLVVIGVDVLVRHFARRRVALALVGLSWLGTLVAVVPYNRHITRLREPLAAAIAAVDHDRAGAECRFACRVVTQIGWYTGCESILLRKLDALPPWPTDRPLYVVSIPHATTPIEPIESGEHATSVDVPTGNARARVWRLVR